MTEANQDITGDQESWTKEEAIWYKRNTSRVRLPGGIEREIFFLEK